MTPPVWVRLSLVFFIGGRRCEVAFASVPLAVFRAMYEHPRTTVIPLEGGPNAYLPAMGCHYEIMLRPETPDPTGQLAELSAVSRTPDREAA